MKLPYGYVLINEEIIVHEEKADAVRSIFGYYLAGASLGKIVDMLYAKGISSPYGVVNRDSKTVRREFSRVYHSKLDAKPQYFGVSPSVGK